MSNQLFCELRVGLFGLVASLLMLALPSGWSKLAYAEEGSTAVAQVFLDKYPLLSQKDPASYREGSPLLTAEDFTDSKLSPDQKAPVSDLACAATVYTMIERGRGNDDATVDDIYVVGRGEGAKPHLLKTVSVKSLQTFDIVAIRSSLASGLPVVLHGTGGPLGQHYVLAVGVRRTAADGEQLIANDPWPGSGKTGPGRRIFIPVRTLQHPYLALYFDKMRLLTPNTAWEERVVDPRKFTGVTIPEQDACMNDVVAGKPVTVGYGAAYNVLSAQRELLIEVGCDESRVNVSVGSRSDTQYIYRYGYIWRSARWEQFKLVGAAQIGDWYVGRGTVDLPRSWVNSNEENHVIAYVCTWTGSQWKCGCRDHGCATGYWQLQTFRWQR